MNASKTGVSAIIVMGVAGSGKTTIGGKLALALDATFIEGDELHPQSNVEKMRNGIPLEDEDRFPWLEAIGAEVNRALVSGASVVASCSALKRTYRDYLRQIIGPRISFIYLDGTVALLSARMSQREGHFMPVALLESQLNTLERPDGEPDVVTISADQDIAVILEKAQAQILKPA